MPFLVAAVVLIGLVAAVNLLLTLGVIRRLNEPSSDPHPGTARPGGPGTELPPGSRAEMFTARTIDGEQVSDADVRGLVGFFSAHCEPCHTLAPLFADKARTMARGEVLAVVAGADADLIATLAPVARVVTEDFDGAVQAAFHNTWTPAVYLLGDDRRVVAGGGRMSDLPSEARA
ncbi:hypothetical protein ACIBSV_01965 [Embleya sp. NPDC050154]|uniref:hypothetical protein n=1 Tax=unclassified Embleya TaxID=2699296 RepID=UPI0037888D0F